MKKFVITVLLSVLGVSTGCGWSMTGMSHCISWPPGILTVMTHCAQFNRGPVHVVIDKQEVDK